MGGGEAWLLFCAWRYGGEDPWRLFNLLDEDYRPVRDASLPAKRPRFPARVRAFMYGCGKAAAIVEGKVKDRRPPPPRERPRVELPPGVEA